MCGDSVIWLHISDAEVLYYIMKHVRVEGSVIALFKDTTFRAHSKVTEDNAIIFSAISLCLQSRNIICGKKMVFYQKDNLLISIEQRSLTTVKSDLSKDSLYYMPPSPLLASPSQSAFSADSLYADGAESTDWKKGRVSGPIFAAMLMRCQKPDLRAKVLETGAVYLLFEMVQSIQELAAPVWRFMSDAQLQLHNQVFIRKKAPGALETTHLFEYADTVARVIELSQTVFKRTITGLLILQERLNKVTVKDSRLQRVCDHYLRDILDEYRFLQESMDLSANEIVKIEKQLETYKSRRSERVSLMLSLTATVFLPATFITGFFGMNFKAGGVLVDVLEKDNGTDAFWILATLSTITMFFLYYAQGLIEMLVSRRYNKYHLS
jgi:Mg2+ and Co2+ transporter CorA